MTPLVTLGLTILFIILAAACWAAMCGVMFGRFDDHRSDTWWGSESWELKYADGLRDRELELPKAHKTYWFYSANEIKAFVLPQWYYDFCKLKYVERFPFSATVLVFITDLFHLAQWFAIKFICLAIAINMEAPIPSFFLLWILWGIGFNVVYLRLKK